MRLDEVIGKVVEVQKTIEGVKQAYQYAPESLAELPCFLNFPASGELEQAPNLLIVTHTIRMQLFVRRGDLSSAEKELRPFVDRVIETFCKNIRLDGSVEYSKLRRYEYGVLTWGETPYLGITFELDATVKQAFEFS